MQNSLEFALQFDKSDELSDYRQRFHIPTVNGKDALYFTGNSLGLQPKTVKSHLIQELEDWAKFGVEGHFEAKNPWVSYHKILSEPFARLVDNSKRHIRTNISCPKCRGNGRLNSTWRASLGCPQRIKTGH